MKDGKKGWLDRKAGKFVSRKFLVWIFASYALITGTLDGDNWVAVALAFIGIEGTAKVAAMYRHGRTFVTESPIRQDDPERMDNTL